MKYNPVLLTLAVLLSGLLGLPVGAQSTPGVVANECPPGQVPTRTRSGKSKKGCVPWPPGTPRPRPRPTPPPEPVSPPTYHAGICPRDLGPFPFPIGRIRHDDVHSFIQTAGINSDHRTSGFYAVNEAHAVAAAVIYYAENGLIVYVPGVHKHSSTRCDDPMPDVTQQRFQTVRSRANSIVWRDYHLVVQNCQNWADLVAG